MDGQLLHTNHGDSWSHLNASGGAQVHNGHNYGGVHNNNQYTLVLHQERTLALGSSERIGVTACISGLRALANDLHGRLANTEMCQPYEASDLRIHLKRSSTQLGAFQSHFRPGFEIPLERASLVQVDQLVACFASAVLLFNNVQEAVKSVQSRPDVDQGPAPALEAYVKKLSNQCEIWQTLLDLIQCPSDDEAHGASFTLEIQTHTLLTEQADLRYRLDSMEGQIRDLSHRADVRHYVNEGSRRLTQQRHIGLHAREFEEVLQRSWVYRRNAKREETMSFRSSIAREHAWSEMSKLTLANVSIISVIALPVKLSELADSSWYQTFDPHLVRSGIVTVATPTVLEVSDQRPSIGPRDVEIARELRIEKSGTRSWPDDEAKAASYLRLELLRKPSEQATSNYFKKARIWAARIPASGSEDGSNTLMPLEDSVLSSRPRLDEKYLDNDDYDTLNVQNRGLYMIHHHSLESMRYRTQILVTSSSKLDRLLSGLQHLLYLRTISLRSTGLKTIPSALLGRSMLASLDVSNNSIVEIPESLARMPRLVELKVYGNPVRTMPIEVWQMKSLERLSVDWWLWRGASQLLFQDVRWKRFESHDVTLESKGWVELRRR